MLISQALNKLVYTTLKKKKLIAEGEKKSTNEHGDTFSVWSNTGTLLPQVVKIMLYYKNSTTKTNKQKTTKV